MQRKALSQIAACWVLGLVVCSVASSAHRSASGPSGVVAKHPIWVRTSPYDTIMASKGGVDTVGKMAAPALVPPRDNNSAEIEVQGDSMTVEVTAPSGLASSWCSWGGEVSESAIPRCAVSGIRVAEVDTGETAPSVQFQLLRPDSGRYRIRITDRDRQSVYLHVGRRSNGRQPYAGAEDDLWIRRGESKTWVTRWSPGDPDSCWVRLGWERSAARKWKKL